jgi:hypothetical protein
MSHKRCVILRFVPVPNKILKMLIATNCVFFSDFLTQHKSDPRTINPNKNKRTNDNIEDFPTPEARHY